MALKLVALAQNNMELSISKLTEMTPAPNLVGVQGQMKGVGAEVDL